MFRGILCHITVQNPDHKEKGISSLSVNGKAVSGNKVPFSSEEKEVYITAVM